MEEGRDRRLSLTGGFESWWMVKGLSGEDLGLVGKSVERVRRPSWGLF